MVRAWGLEPQRITAREPKSRMSTNSIMPAYSIFPLLLPYIIPVYVHGPFFWKRGVFTLSSAGKIVNEAGSREVFIFCKKPLHYV